MQKKILFFTLLFVASSSFSVEQDVLDEVTADLSPEFEAEAEAEFEEEFVFEAEEFEEEEFGTEEGMTNSSEGLTDPEDNISLE